MPKQPRAHRRRGSGRKTAEGPPRSLTVSRLGTRGDGIADTADGPVYIAGALPGETVTARVGATRGDGRTARLVSIDREAPERTGPPCPHAGSCGGCQVQHLAFPAYTAWKQSLMTDALARHGVTPGPGVIRPVITVPVGSRRRIVPAAIRIGDRVVLGFNARRSAMIVDIGNCPVARPELVALLAPLRDLLPTLLPGGGRADIALTRLDDGIDMVLTGGPAPDLTARESLARFAESADLARLSWSASPGAAVEPIAHRRPGTVTFAVGGAGFPVTVPPGGFLQATAEGEHALQAVVADAIDGATRIADLFAGAGTFTAPVLAIGAHVLAADSVPAGLEAVQTGARRAGCGERLTVRCQDLFASPLTAAELGGLEAVIIDPPRAGAAAQTAAIAEAGVPTVAAVSCDPASFARDARHLLDAGYRLDLVQPVDQFLWSGHLELAAVFRLDG